MRLRQRRLHRAQAASVTRKTCPWALFNGTSETPDDLSIAAVMDEQVDDGLNSFCFGFRIHEKRCSVGENLGEKLLGAGLLRILEDLLRGAALDDHAGIEEQ